MIIGLTGSFGSGKTTVAEMFKELGATIIDADEIAREVVLPGKPAYFEIIEFFGEDIKNPDGSLNRKKIAEIVFNDKDKLQKLNSIIHPKVRERELELLEKYKNAPLIVFVVPLLFENNLEKYVDQTVTVVVDEQTRINRLTEKRKISIQEIQNRLKNQLPQEEKIKRSDFIIDNSGSLEMTRSQVVNLFNKILKIN